MSRYFFDTDIKRGCEHPWQMDLKQHLFEGLLWVLGGYELLRTLNQKMREDHNLKNHDFTNEVAGLKRRFARIRVPLAKIEASAAFKNQDIGAGLSNVGWSTRGIIFMLNKETAYSYNDVSTELFLLLRRWPRELFAGRRKLFGTFSNCSPMHLIEKTKKF